MTIQPVYTSEYRGEGGGGQKTYTLFETGMLQRTPQCINTIVLTSGYFLFEYKVNSKTKFDFKGPLHYSLKIKLYNRNK